MFENDLEQSPSGLSVNDVMFILFRHKWTILISTAIGLLAVAGVYFLMPPSYESQAKLLVRYVVERSAIDSVDSQPRMAAENLINSEVEILTSRDLAASVVEDISPELLFPKTGGSGAAIDAIRKVQLGLTVSPLKGSNIILVSYKHGDPAMASRVLDDLVRRYLSKHLEVHRSLGAFDFVSQQSDKIKFQLSETEDELKRLKGKEGILSLVDSSASLNTELAQCVNDLHATETELMEQQAKVKEMEKWIVGAATDDESSAPAPRDSVLQHQGLVTRIAKLRQTEFDALAKYTPESSIASRIRAQLRDAEDQRRSLERKYPSLAVAASSSATTPDPRTDLMAERARLSSIQAKQVSLKSQLDSLRQTIQRFSEIGPQIAQLERKRGLDEETYKYYQASLEKARIDEALDPSKMPNISVVQKPSTATRVSSKIKKRIMLGLLGGGLGLGVAIALFMELLVDRSVKRPLEFGAQLRIPMLCWIPFIGRNERLLLQSRKGRPSSSLALAKADSANDLPWEPGHFFRSFAGAIRDRLLLFFEITKTSHKPKLIAVTSCSGGAGTSTIAGGLATALSEAGDEKVLLVDMHDASAEVHPFFEGQPIFSLSDAVESKGAMCAAAENLYLATAALAVNGGGSIAPKSFYNMVPRFHTSDFDYVIFDMPPLDRSSSTLAVARFMDKILLVVESGKSSREVVQRSFSELKAANLNVSAVLNKTRSYTPRWLGSEC